MKAELTLTHSHNIKSERIKSAPCDLMLEQKDKSKKKKEKEITAPSDKSFSFIRS